MFPEWGLKIGAQPCTKTLVKHVCKTVAKSKVRLKLEHVEINTNNKMTESELKESKT